LRDFTLSYRLPLFKERDKFMQLQDVRKIITIELSDYPGSKVEIYDDILSGDYMDLTEQENKIAKDFSLIRAAKQIKSWNFDDESGKILEINPANLKRLTLKALTEILDVVLNREQEKKEQKS